MSRGKAAQSEAPTFRERLAGWLLNMEFVLYTALVLVLLAVGFLWHRMFIIIPPGHSGVMYRTMYGGTVTNHVWNEGLHIIPPWDKLTSYETRLQQQTIKFIVLSDEGLNLGVQVAVRFRPHREQLGYLHRDIGEKYYERLVRPEVEAHIRRTFGNRPAHEIYASSRDVLQELNRVPALGRLDGAAAGPLLPYVHIQELKLVTIELPKVVEAAIAERYRQEQLMLEYQYKLAREDKEAERKRTEAAGIRDFNLITGKISTEVLRWRGIEAAQDLAKSPNSKVIMLGGGQSGIPVMLNLGDMANSSPESAAPAEGGRAAPRVSPPRTGAQNPPALQAGDKPPAATLAGPKPGPAAAPNPSPPGPP